MAAAERSLRLVLLLLAACLAAAPARAELRLDVAGDTGRFDDPLTVRLSGAPSGARVTLELEGAPFGATVRRATTEAEADASGQLDAGPALTPLLWRMRTAAPGDAVITSGSSRSQVTYRVTAETTGGTRASALLVRTIRAPFVIRAPPASARDGADGGAIELRPRCPGTYPPLVILRIGAAWSAVVRAELLASRGFAVTVLTVAAEGNLVDLPIEPMLAAIAAAEADPAATPGLPAGLYGVSRGAELALLLGSRRAGSGPVMAIAPSAVVLPRDIGGRANLALPRWAWTEGGAPVPFVGGPNHQPLQDPLVGQAPPWRMVLRQRAMLERAREIDPEGLARARIPVEAITAPVFLLAGESDGLGPTADWARQIAGARTASERPTVLHIFANAGHRLALPNLPAGPSVVELDPGGPLFDLGGDEDATGEAMSRGWYDMIRMLEDWLMAQRPALAASGALPDFLKGRACVGAR